MAQAITNEQHLRVHVSGWSYNRHVVVRDNEVAMEIARTHCSHCPTCRSRIAHCEQALGTRKFKRQSAGGGEYFVLPLKAALAKGPQGVAEFLGKTLKLSLTPVA